MVLPISNINPVLRFVIYFAILAFVWYPLYSFVLNPYTNIDEYVINVTLGLSKWILQSLGHSAFVEGRVIRIAGTSGLWVGDNCNAIALFALFTGFIISFPGNVKSKIWFIPIGISLIFFMNCLRMVLLAIIDTYSREWTEFNHTYTFTILIYGFIFIMWMFWVNRFSFINKSSRDQKTD